MLGKVLTEEAEEMRADWELRYADTGCTCFISPPCSYCTHEGNPANQAEDESCWMDAPPVHWGLKAYF